MVNRTKDDPLTKEDAAKALHVSKKKIDQLIDCKLLKIEKLGDMVWVRRDSIIELTNSGYSSEKAISAWKRMRRKVIKTIGLFGFGVVAGIAANIVDRRFFLKLFPSVPTPPVSTVSVKSHELLRNLIGLYENDLSLSVGDIYNQIKDFHPENVAAGKALASVLGIKKEALLSTGKHCDISVDPDENLIVAGGPLGSLYSKIAFEFDGPDYQHMERPRNPIIPLRWYGSNNVDDPMVKELGRVFYMMEKIGPANPPNWPIIDTHTGIFIEVSTGDRLKEYKNPTYRIKDNYLTVTRMPNYLSKKSDELLQKKIPLSEWPQIIIFDGMNGIGTRGVELLVTEAGEIPLEDALRAIQNFSSSYQMLFRLTNLDSSAGYDRFSSIEFVDAFDLSLGYETVQRANAYAKKQLEMGQAKSI